METAEEFWNLSCKNDKLKSPSDIMIEFAKHHVDAALKAAAENSKVCPTDYQPIPNRKVGSAYVIIDRADIMIVVDKESITNSYPLTDIK